MRHSVRAFAEGQIRNAQDLKLELYALGVDEEDEAFADTIEGECNFEDVADELLQCLEEDEALLKGIKDLQNKLAVRKARIETRVKGYKALAHRVLDAAATRKMERPSGTIYLAKSAQQLGDIDEAKIPTRFWVEQDPKIDRRALKKALTDGEEIPGATLTSPEDSVRIR